MSSIDPRAEAARRGAEEARRAGARTSAEDLARAVELANGMASALDPANARGAPELARILRGFEGLRPEAQRVFLASAAGAAVGDPTAARAAEAAQAVGASIRQAFPPGSGRWVKLGEALAHLQGRSTQGMRAEASAAVASEAVARLAGETSRPEPPRAAPADVVERGGGAGRFGELLRQAETTLASREAPASESPDGQALPVRSMLRWDSSARAVTGPGVKLVGEQLGTIAKRMSLVREALANGEGENLRVQYGLKQAGGFFDKLDAGVEAAEGVLARVVASARAGAVLRGVATAGSQLREIQVHAEQASESLGEVAGWAKQVPVNDALRELRAVGRAARGAEGELRMVGGRAAILEGVEAQGPPSAPLTPAEPAAAAAAAPSVVVPGESLSEEDLRRIGSALDPSKPPAQTLWNENMVNLVSVEGRKQGGITEEQGGRNAELARQVLGGDGQGPRLELTAADVAAVLKQSGLDLARVDPNQVAAASRYLNTATTLGDQQEKLRKVLDNFQTLDRIGLPRMSKEQLMGQLDTYAKVPGKATAKLGENELKARFNEIAATLNGGGELQTKVGKYNLKLSVDQLGQVSKSECKKPGFFSKLGSFFKKVVPIALTVASFIPVTAPFARAAQGVISLVNAIKAKSLMGFAAAGAAIVGAGAAIARGASTVVGTVERAANAVARGLQGVSQLRQGNVIGGLASVGAAVADGIGRVAGGATSGLQRVANRLGDTSAKLSMAAQGLGAVQGYQAASRAVDKAKEALAQARVSGDTRAIAAAEQQLEEAERAKRGALLGGAAAAATIAADYRANYRTWKGGPVEQPPPATGLDVALRSAARGLNVARDVSNRDLESAAVNAVGLAASVTASPSGSESRIGLQDAANLADAALGYRQAEKARSAADKVVADAERALEAARRSGDAEAIRQATANLGQARRSRESALMGSIGAGDSLMQTAAAIGEKKHKEDFKKEVERAAASWQDADKAEQEWRARLVDPQASPEAKEAARVGIEALRRAKEAYNRAIGEAKGDPGKLEAATAAFEKTRQGIEDVPAHATGGAAAASPPPLASLRRPEKVGTVTVRPGATVWELSQRTGVPVERILEFNAQMGNALDPERLQLGQKILVPLGADEVRFTPKKAEEVQAMKDQAVLEKRLASMPPPRVLSPEVPFPLGEGDLRSRALASLGNDRALVADDERASRFDPLSPSTWVDTKEDEARYAARKAFSEAVDRLDAVLQDRTSSDEQIRAALTDKQTALNLYSRARGTVEQKDEGGNYLTPIAEIYTKTVADPFHEQTQKVVDAIDQSALPEMIKTAAKAPLQILDKEVSFDFKGAIQTGQEALHSETKQVIDAIDNLGAPAPVAFAATLPLHVVDSVVNFDAGVLEGAVSIPEGIAQMAVHPVDTVEGLGQLAARAMETTPQGRAALFLKDLVTGKFETQDDALKAMQDSMDPVLTAKAGLSLTEDVLKGVFADAIQLAKQGKYDEAVGVVLGQNLPMLPGVLRKIGQAGRAGAEVTEAASQVSRGAAVEGRAAAEVADAAADARKAVTPAAAATEGTRAGEVADTIAPKAAGTSEVSFQFDESGLTVRAEGQITGPHRGRGKGYRPEPIGGREPGDHRGHLIPEGGVEDPRLVNVKPNIISEAAWSNLGAKKVFDNLVSRIAAENPKSVIKVIAEPLRRPGQTRPFAVTYWIEKDGVRIHGQTILNRK